mgnify:CR=1 FL=1
MYLTEKDKLIFFIISSMAFVISEILFFIKTNYLTLILANILFFIVILSAILNFINTEEKNDDYKEYFY